MGWLIDDFLDNISSKKIYFIIAVCIIGFLIYSNTFTAPFVFDDIGTVYGNNALRKLNLLLEWWSFLKPRFLGYLTFLLNYKIAGWNLALYHITNLLLHILTTFFVWRLVLLIFETPRFKESYISTHKKYIALFCALIFLTHPIQTQAVTYIVQRFTALAALFYILSVYFFIKARIKKSLSFFIFSIFSMLLAFWSKENAFSIPVMLIVCELYFFSNFRKFINLKFIALWIFFFAVCIKFIFQLVSLSDAFGKKVTFAGENITSQNYLISQFGILIRYLKLLIIPVGQSIDHYESPINNIFEPSVVAGIIVLSFIVILAVITFRKYRLISFSIAWFLVSMSVESSFIPIQDLMVEHRLYLPTFGFSLFITLIIYYFSRNKIAKKWPYVFVILILIYGVMTFARNNVWISKVSIWLDAVKKNSNNDRALTNLGGAYSKDKNYKQAQYYLDKSLSINPKNPDALVIKGALIGQQGQLDEALDLFYRALELFPNHIGAYSNIAVIYYKQEKYDEAANVYKKILEISPDNVTVYEMLSYVLVLGGQEEEAKEYMQKAIRLDSSSVDTFKKMEESLKKSRDTKSLESSETIN